MKLLSGITIIFLAILQAAIFTVTFAADGASGRNESDKTVVITPANMSRDDEYLLNEYSARYNECLTETSVKQLQTADDPRHVVDHAMKTCAVKLEELDRKMIERNFDPDFRKGYIRRVSNRSANNVLRTVMMGMAARQGQAEE